jgi:hypothetical protein
LRRRTTYANMEPTIGQQWDHDAHDAAHDTPHDSAHAISHAAGHDTDHDTALDDAACHTTAATNKAASTAVCHQHNVGWIVQVHGKQCRKSDWNQFLVVRGGQ